MPTDGGLPHAPQGWEAEDTWGGPGRCWCVLCAHTCPTASSGGAPMGCNNGVRWAQGAHPCTLLGWSPPGLGVGQEETQPKLSC